MVVLFSEHSVLQKNNEKKNSKRPISTKEKKQETQHICLLLDKYKHETYLLVNVYINLLCTLCSRAHADV